MLQEFMKVIIILFMVLQYIFSKVSKAILLLVLLIVFSSKHYLSSIVFVICKPGRRMFSNSHIVNINLFTLNQGVSTIYLVKRRKLVLFGSRYSSDCCGDGPKTNNLSSTLDSSEILYTKAGKKKTALAARLFKAKQQKKANAAALLKKQTDNGHARWKRTAGKFRITPVSENETKSPIRHNLRSTHNGESTQSSSLSQSTQKLGRGQRERKQTQFFGDETTTSQSSKSKSPFSPTNKIVRLKNKNLPMARKNGSYPIPGGSVHLKKCSVEFNEQAVQDLANELNNCCSYGNNNDAKDPIYFEGPATVAPNVAAATSTAEKDMKSSRDLKSASIGGITAPSDNQNKINLPGTDEQTNAPRPYKVKQENGEHNFLKDIRNNKIMYYMFCFMDALVAELYPNLHKHIMDVIPANYRIFPTLCFCYFGKTGGTNGGYCHVHKDSNSIINGIFQLGVPQSGGTTLFYDNKKKELMGVPHCQGNMILAPFKSTYHGGSAWTGFRVIVGCYVDERTIKFFHKFDAPSEEDAVDSIYYFSEKNDKFRVRTPVECAKLEKIFFDTCVNEPKKVTCAGGGRSAHFLGRVTGEEEAKYYIDASNITHTKPMSQTYIDRINALQIAYTENMK